MSFTIHGLRLRDVLHYLAEPPLVEDPTIELTAIHEHGRPPRRATFMGYGTGDHPRVGAYLYKAGSRWRITGLTVHPYPDDFWRGAFDTVEDPEA